MFILFLFFLKVCNCASFVILKLLTWNWCRKSVNKSAWDPALDVHRIYHEHFGLFNAGMFIYYRSENETNNHHICSDSSGNMWIFWMVWKALLVNWNITHSWKIVSPIIYYIKVSVRSYQRRGWLKIKCQSFHCCVIVDIKIFAICEGFVPCHSEFNLVLAFN